MPRTYIKYKSENGFWISEEYLQLTYYYIYLELGKPQYTLPNKAKLLEFIKFQIDGFAVDMMSLGWNSYFVDNPEIQMMIDMLERVKADLLSRGSHITVQELQSIISDDDFFKNFISERPFPVSEQIKIIDALIQLLKGTWEYTNYSMEVDY